MLWIIRRKSNVVQLIRSRELGCREARTRLQTAPNDSQLLSDLEDWAENGFLQRCASQYVEFDVPARSTIAAAFSPDGTVIASTQWVTNIRARML